MEERDVEERYLYMYIYGERHRRMRSRERYSEKKACVR